MSKFNTLFEEQLGQFTQQGPIAGDYVKIKGEHTSSEWYKALDETRQNYVNEILTLSEQGKYLMLSTIKKGIYETDTVDSEAQLADIAVEMAPGFYDHNLTIPMELLKEKYFCYASNSVSKPKPHHFEGYSSETTPEGLAQ